jgi:hypothetical protein
MILTRQDRPFEGWPDRLQSSKKPQEESMPKSAELIQLPDPPVLPVDPVDTNNTPEISQEQVLDYLRARYTYERARTYFEVKRAAIAYMVTMGCKTEPSSNFELRLGEHGQVIVEETCSCCLQKSLVG